LGRVLELLQSHIIWLEFVPWLIRSQEVRGFAAILVNPETAESDAE